MLEAGYGPDAASQGMRAVPATVLALMPAEANLVELGRLVSPEQQEHMVRGRLMLNVMRGHDKGVNSAYRLGQDKRVNMFTADTQVGVILVQAPETHVKALSQVPDDEENKPTK